MLNFNRKIPLNPIFTNIKLVHLLHLEIPRCFNCFNIDSLFFKTTYFFCDFKKNIFFLNSGLTLRYR